MSETPPESADQDQPEEGYGPQVSRPSWRTGQTVRIHRSRYGPQSSQPGEVVQPPGAMPFWPDAVCGMLPAAGAGWAQ